MTPDTQVNSVAPGLIPTQFADFITKDETVFQIVNQSSTWVKFAYKPHFELSLTVEKRTYYLTGLVEIRCQAFKWVFWHGTGFKLYMRNGTKREDMELLGEVSLHWIVLVQQFLDLKLPLLKFCWSDDELGCYHRQNLGAI